MKKYFVILGVVIFLLLSGCAKQSIPLPADARNVVESESMILYTTEGLEHYVCKDRSAFTYTTAAAMQFEAPSCDSNGSFSISTFGEKLAASVELNDYSPEVGQQLTGSYHFELFEGDDPNPRYFTDCTSSQTDEPLLWGHSEFHVTVGDAPKTVVIICTLDTTVVSASFTVAPQQP